MNYETKTIKESILSWFGRTGDQVEEKSTHMQISSRANAKRKIRRKMARLSRRINR